MTEKPSPRVGAAAHDSGDMLAAVGSLGDQFETGWAAATAALRDAGGAASQARPDGVVVCGMGGSAIGADLIRVCSSGLPVPFEVVRGYELPAWVSTATLVIAVSYSGDTTETLACTRAAVSRGCTPLCVASGGELHDLAHAEGLPAVPVPGGLQPRAALGLLATPVAAALEHSGLARGFGEQVAEAAALLRKLAAAYGPDRKEGENPAKALARRLAGRVAVVYGAGVTAPAARRWKGQLNENAKAMAFFAELPELDHNELMGWTGADELGGLFHVIVLDDVGAAPELRRRAALTVEHVTPHAAAVETFATSGVAPLARACSALYLGDFVSCYLAELRDVDPTPVEAIEAFKRRLAADEDAKR